MRSICDSCEAAPAKLFCAADEAALCTTCDEKIHGCNKLASRHVRLQLAEARKVPKCDICENAPAFFYCGVDGTSLCLQCDLDVHIGGKKTHERYLLMGQRVESISQLPENPRSEKGREEDLHTDAGTAITGSDQVLETAGAVSFGGRQEQSHCQEDDRTQQQHPHRHRHSLHHQVTHHHHHHHHHHAPPLQLQGQQKQQQQQQEQQPRVKSPHGHGHGHQLSIPNDSETMEDAKLSSEGDSEPQQQQQQHRRYLHHPGMDTEDNNNNKNSNKNNFFLLDDRAGAASLPTISGINESNAPAVAMMMSVGEVEGACNSNTNALLLRTTTASALAQQQQHHATRGGGAAAAEAPPQLLLSTFNLNLRPLDEDPGLQETRRDFGSNTTTKDGGVVDVEVPSHLEAGQRDGGSGGGGGGDESLRMDVTMNSPHVMC